MTDSDSIEAITREHVDASQLRLRSLWKMWSPRWLAHVSAGVQAVRKSQESARHVQCRCSAIHEICQHEGFSLIQPLTISMVMFDRAVKLVVFNVDTDRAVLASAGRQAATT